MANPWFPLYAPDFVASTMSMSPQTVGAYIRLLCYSWLNGSIPGDMESLERITGGITPQAWEEIRSRLEEVSGSENAPSRWVHPRMERERVLVEQKHAAASHKGKRGATARWGVKASQPDARANARAMPVPMPVPLPKHCPSNGNHNHNHTNTPPLTGGGVGEGGNQKVQKSYRTTAHDAVSRAADGPPRRLNVADGSEGQQVRASAAGGNPGDLPFRDATPLELARIQRWPGCKAIDNDSVDKQRVVFIRTLKEKQIGNAMIRAAWEASVKNWGETGKSPYEFAMDELISDWENVKQPDSIIKYRLGGAA